MKKDNQFLRNSATHGALLGLALVSISVINYAFDMYNQSTIMSVLNVTVSVLGLFLAIKTYRNNFLDGVITYGQSLGYGIVVSAFAGIITALFSYILMTYIDPEFLQKMMIEMEEDLINRGMSDEEIEQSMFILGKMKSPMLMLFSGIIGQALWGTLISLVVSIFLQKKSSNPFDDAMSKIEN